MNDLKAIRVIEGTKISHDYDGGMVHTFGYRDLIQRRVPAIGIPAKQNGLVIIDVDAVSETGNHKYDGREWWENFSEEAGIPLTYTVGTRSGGYHLYFKLPQSINPETFAPPSKLAYGVDIKYNGWVKAPPTEGYTILWGTIEDIAEAPPSLLMEINNARNGVVKDNNTGDPFHDIVNLHKPFTDHQIKQLRNNIEWLQASGTLSRDEWRDGLFALKAGIDDPEILDELVDKWTYNQSYVQGDELVARDIVERADKHGPIGPGSIFAILKNVSMRTGAVMPASELTRQEIIDKSEVRVTIADNGTLKMVASESNVANLLGTMFSSDQLYHDIREGNYIYKGKSYSEGELANIFAPMIQSPKYGLGFEQVKKATITSAIDVLMASREIDPHAKWLEEIQWDGVPRIDNFFADYAGVEPSEYVTAVSKNMWIALAARGLKPGSKFDCIVILEGLEGTRKSSLVEAIGGQYYLSLASKEDINGTDTLRKMHQSTVVELPELIGLIGKSGEEIKAIVATSVDSIRDLYVRRAVKRPRGFIFIGTTNSKRYITDDMGWRRFWPIKIPSELNHIDTDRVKADREQLFAEAVARYRNNEEYWTVPDSAQRVVGGRKYEDPLTGAIHDMLRDNPIGLRILDIYSQLEMRGLVTKGFNPRVSKRIESALNTIGAIEAEQGEEILSLYKKRWLAPAENDTALLAMAESQKQISIDNFI